LKGLHLKTMEILDIKHYILSTQAELKKIRRSNQKASRWVFSAVGLNVFVQEQGAVEAIKILRIDPVTLQAHFLLGGAGLLGLTDVEKNLEAAELAELIKARLQKEYANYATISPDRL